MLLKRMAIIVMSLLSVWFSFWANRSHRMAGRCLKVAKMLCE